MNVRIGSFLNLWVNTIPQKTIQKFRFKIIPFIVKELKIGDLFHLTSGITYVKVLSEPIPEITPKIKVNIRKISISELLNSNISNLGDFSQICKSKRQLPNTDNMRYFVATSGNELAYITSVGYASRGRLMISGTNTLLPYRGNHINSAVLIYIMKYLKNTEKIDKVYISTGGANMSMQRSILRAEFKLDSIFYSLSLFKIHIRPVHFFKNLCKKLWPEYKKRDEAQHIFHQRAR